MSESIVIANSTIRQQDGLYCLFQLTAARRRLAASFLAPAAANPGFNSQPPEGGWDLF